MRLNPIILKNLCKRILSSNERYMCDPNLVFLKLVNDKKIENNEANKKMVKNICSQCIQNLDTVSGVGIVNL